MAEWPLNFAAQVVKQGISANEGLRQLRASGMGIRRQDWLMLVREARTALEGQAGGFFVPGNRRPTASETLVFTVPNATGFMQYIDVWVKDRATGEISIRPYGLRTDDLMTHDDAIETALDRFSESAEEYGETILGGVYQATYVFNPVGR